MDLGELLGWTMALEIATYELDGGRYDDDTDSWIPPPKPEADDV